MRELEISVSLDVSFNGITFRIMEREEDEGLLPEVMVDTDEAGRLSAFFLACGVTPDTDWLREALGEDAGPDLRLLE